jgi:hypothetical protein
MNPVFYCPRCGGRMSCEDPGEWSCFTCGELLFILQPIDLRIPEVRRLGNPWQPLVGNPRPSIVRGSAA